MSNTTFLESLLDRVMAGQISEAVYLATLDRLGEHAPAEQVSNTPPAAVVVESEPDDEIVQAIYGRNPLTGKDVYIGEVNLRPDGQPNLSALNKYRLGLEAHERNLFDGMDSGQRTAFAVARRKGGAIIYGQERDDEGNLVDGPIARTWTGGERWENGIQKKYKGTLLPPSQPGARERFESWLSRQGGTKTTTSKPAAVKQASKPASPKADNVAFVVSVATGNEPVEPAVLDARSWGNAVQESLVSDDMLAEGIEPERQLAIARSVKGVLIARKDLDFPENWHTLNYGDFIQKAGEIAMAAGYSRAYVNNKNQFKVEK